MELLSESVKSNDQFQSWPTASQEQNTKRCLNSYHELDGKIVTAHSSALGSNSSSHNIDEQNEQGAFCTNTNSEVHVLSKLTIQTSIDLEKDNILYLADRNICLPNDVNHSILLKLRFPYILSYIPVLMGQEQYSHRADSEKQMPLRDVFTILENGIVHHYWCTLKPGNPGIQVICNKQTICCSSL